MNVLTRRPAAAVTVTGILVGAVVLAAGWLGNLDRATRAPETPNEMDDFRLSIELDQKWHFLARCHAAKVAVARDLVAGRPSLLEAAARVRTIDRENPHFRWDQFRRHRPAGSDAERHCREAIECISIYLSPSPANDRAAARYAADLEALLRLGPISLPELDRAPAP
jgi:hypothetical protein